MEKRVFRSRISVLLIVFIFAIFIPGSISILKYKIYEGMYILIGVLVFLIFVFSGMRYVISDGKLYLKMWLIPNGSVEIMNIVSVERSYNPLSSPAASLKRLCINFNNNVRFPYWLISPVREQEFIDALKAVNPDISVHVPIEKGIWCIWDWDI